MRCQRQSFHKCFSLIYKIQTHFERTRIGVHQIRRQLESIILVANLNIAKLFDYLRNSILRLYSYHYSQYINDSRFSPNGQQRKTVISLEEIFTQRRNMQPVVEHVTATGNNRRIEHLLFRTAQRILQNNVGLRNIIHGIQKISFNVKLGNLVEQRCTAYIAPKLIKFLIFVHLILFRHTLFCRSIDDSSCGCINFLTHY